MNIVEKIEELPPDDYVHCYDYEISTNEVKSLALALDKAEKALEKAHKGAIALRDAGVPPAYSFIGDLHDALTKIHALIGEKTDVNKG